MAVDKTCGISDWPSTAVPGIQYCQKLWLRGWSYIPSITLLVPTCPKISRVVGDWYDYKTSTTFPDRVNGEFFTSARLGPVERLRSGLHAHGTLVTISGTDSIRSKLPPLYVPVSPSPVSRQASRDLWRSIGPSTIVVFKLRTSLSPHLLCPQMEWTI